MEKNGNLSPTFSKGEGEKGREDYSLNLLSSGHFIKIKILFKAPF